MHAVRTSQKLLHRRLSTVTVGHQRGENVAPAEPKWPINAASRGTYWSAEAYFAGAESKRVSLAPFLIDLFLLFRTRLRSPRGDRIGLLLQLRQPRRAWRDDLRSPNTIFRKYCHRHLFRAVDPVPGSRSRAIHSRANHRSVREGGTSSRDNGSRCGSCLGRVGWARFSAGGSIRHVDENDRKTAVECLSWRRIGRATSCTALPSADPASSSCKSHRSLFVCSQRRGISACRPHRSN
jgi:hypothetical protein